MCGMCVGTGTGTQEFNQQLNTLVEPNIKHLYIDIYIYISKQKPEGTKTQCVCADACVREDPTYTVYMSRTACDSGLRKPPCSVVAGSVRHDGFMSSADKVAKIHTANNSDAHSLTFRTT